jgi:hypothetical protein
MSRSAVVAWEKKFASLKPTLGLYLRCHSFIRLTFEGDEQYTKVRANKPPMESEGWTIKIMERLSRFILEEKCGPKDEELFRAVMQELIRIAKNTGELEFFSDGERRYGNTLFALCGEVLLTGKIGRPARTLPKGLKVRLKNKGSRAHKRGRKRKKYEQPHKEHPLTGEVLESDIHANHVEADNASNRRKNSCYRRKTNTYAKDTTALQRTLDRKWISHNFIIPHFTTHEVPAVALGIIDEGMTYETVLMMQRMA